MKRIISSLLIIIILAATIVNTVSAAGNNFATNIRVSKSSVTWNDKVDGSGRNYETVTLEYRLRGNGIRGIQGVWIAVDITSLLWIDPVRNGRSVQLDINNGSLVKGESTIKYDKIGMYTLKEKVIGYDGEVDEWVSGSFSFNSVALSGDGRTLYIGLQPMQTGKVNYAEFTTVMSISLAVLGNGVDADDVRVINTTERAMLNQSFIAAMSDGVEGYYYGDKSAADTLSSPTVTGNAFTASDDSGNEDDEPETTLPFVDETEPETTPPFVDETEPETERPSETKPEWKNPFVDVPNDAEYIDAIEFVYENGLFKGTSTTEFEPDTTMTRAMFVTVLGRLSGVDESKYSSGAAFDDVVEGEWYAPHVKWAAECGIVEGYGDGKFGVDDEVTIEQAVVILSRYASYCDIDVRSNTGLSRFPDYKKVSTWAKMPMKWAVECGIYNGMGGILRPQTPAKRSLVAELFYAYVTIIVD